MNVYLIKVEITDSGREYREFGLVEADDYGEAERLAHEQVARDNSGNQAQAWWTIPADEVEVKLKGIEPIDDEDAEFLQIHGLAYFINR